MTNGRIGATEDRHLRSIFELGAVSLHSDGQLLERFNARPGQGAELAFAALVERHGSMVLRACRGILRDRQLAEDAFQGTFLILARKSRSLWVRESIAPWLHAVACRVASSTRASEARRRKHEGRASRPESLWPEQVGDDLARVLHEEIDRLPEPFRAAVVLCHLEALTQHEAAHRLGWPVGTLQSRLDRGRRRLRDRLTRRGLAPLSIAPLPCLTLSASLVATTARAANVLSSGGSITGLIGPGVLTILNVSAKGVLMTKWKIAVSALIVGASLVTTTMGLTPQQAATTPAKLDQAFTANASAPIVETQAEPIPPATESPGFPVLLGFYSLTNAPSGLLRSSFQELVSHGYPVKLIDVDRSKDLVAPYKINEVPTLVLVDGAGFELARHAGTIPTLDLARFYNDNLRKVVEAEAHGAWKALADRRAQRAEKAAVESPSTPNVEGDQKVPGTVRKFIEPARKAPDTVRKFIDRFAAEPPHPAETVVVVRTSVKRGKADPEIVRGLGTIVRAKAEETLILTTASLFVNEPGGSRLTRLSTDKATVTLPLAMTGAGSPSNWPAEVVASDMVNSLVLIKIQPGRVLPSVRVAPVFKKRVAGTVMIGTGLVNDGGTSWQTSMVDPLFRFGSSTNHDRFPLIQCELKPDPSQVGGGLFDLDKQELEGVFLFNLENDQTSLYAGPEAIHKLLDGYGLASIRGDKPEETLKPVPSLTYPDIKYTRPIEKPVQLEPEPTTPKIIDEEFDLSIAPIPRPWETVVRVKVKVSDKEYNFGSGTVIQSDANESIILACAHSFKLKGQPLPVAASYRTPIEVDLFNGVLTGRSPAMVQPGVKSLVAHTIAFDEPNDLALIKIDQGGLPVSPVVASDWTPQKGMAMVSLGCSNGNDATAWSTQILDPQAPSLTGLNRPRPRMIKCANLPKEGRSGGGLYTSDGHVAGVCCFADPKEKAGYYAGPTAIRALLDRTETKEVNQGKDQPLPVARGSARPRKPAAPPTVFDDAEPRPAPTEQERRLIEVERKLDQILKSLDKPTLNK